jgi:uncharacterized membrane protein
MDGARVLTLLHVLIGIVFIAGLLGRWVLLTRAARAEEIETAHLLTEASGPFERMVIIGSQLVFPAGLAAAWARGYPLIGLGTSWVLLATVLYLSLIPLVPLVFLPSGRRFEAEMLAAREAGSVTAGLRAAFNDRHTALARNYEVAAVLIIVALMVLKPNLW